MLDFTNQAKWLAEKLHEEGCDVLVLLSHTGVSRGDMDLAKLGLFDIIFSGHEHLYNLDSF